MTTIPIPDACSLDRAAFDARLAWVREHVPRPRQVLTLPDGVVWEFDPRPGLRSTLETLVRLEAGCCDPARIRFRLENDAPDAGLRLAVRGIDAHASPWGTTPARSGPLRRLGQAGGLGAAAAFALLCGLPMLVTAVAGAALAAPLARLESPWALGAGTLVLGGLAWVWLRRRGAGC